MNQTTYQLRRDLLEIANYEGIYTIDPETSYFKRFPTCIHVKEVVCSDQSCFSKCPEGAYGEQGCQAMPIPWEQCSGCKKYQPK